MTEAKQKFPVLPLVPSNMVKKLRFIPNQRKTK